MCGIVGIFNLNGLPLNQEEFKIFNNSQKIAKNLNINLNLRPQNLSPDTYYKITNEYENLRS